MNEEEKVKKQIRTNMLLNLITFSIIFYILGIVIYNQFTNSVYKSADLELEQSFHQFREEQSDSPKKPINNQGQEMENIHSEEEREQNPRLVYIERDADGNLIEDSEQNQTLNTIFTNVEFDSTIIDTIYQININNEYTYRGINFQLDNGNYMQVLINVDSEIDMIQEFRTILVIALILSVLIIILASYILSKKTLKPIVASWKRQNQFVQDASHELRTPLAIIQAKQETLLEKPDSKIIDNAEEISTTLKETQRLTKLVKELMELARGDSKSLELHKETFNLDEEIQNITNLYKDVATAEKKEFVLDLNFKENIVADSNKIKELLVILLDNSIKYTEEGDSITIKTQKKDNKAILEVMDTGIGISKEAQKHIFERFYREEKSRDREKGGMGLGLSIAYNIVKLHKGTIKVDKNRKKGTNMIVKLPCK